MLFELPAVMDIAGVATLKEQLSALLDQPEAIQLGGESVERIDASSLQLLVGFAQEAASRGLEIDWRGVSEELSASARLMDLSDNLNLA